MFLLSSFPNSSHSFLLPYVLNNRVTIVEVQLYGDVVLRYVNYKDPAQLYDPNPDSWFLPGFEPVPSSFPLDFGLRRLDHAVGNVSDLNVTFHDCFDILSAPDDGVGADPKQIHHLSRRISGPDRRRTCRRERLELGEARLKVGGEDGIDEAGAVDGEGRRKKEVKEREEKKLKEREKEQKEREKEVKEMKEKEKRKEEVASCRLCF